MTQPRQEHPGVDHDARTIECRWNKYLNGRATTRRAQAMAYVWGREDMGDDRINKAITAQQGEHSFGKDWLFANWAGTYADAYVNERCTSLPSIQSQYRTFRYLVEDGYTLTAGV